MPTVHKTPIAATTDIPVLRDMVIPGDGRPMAPAIASPVPPATAGIAEGILADMLTERIAALTDRLLRDASVDIHATLVNKVWERLRDEIPALVQAALRENGHGR